MDLKEILGENYKEDMTVEQISAALADIDPTKGYIKKEQFDKAASEAAAAKKALAAKMTDDEAAKAAEAAKIAELEEKYGAMLKESTIAKHKASLLGLKYDEKLAEQTATALFEGDFETMVKNQAIHISNMEKSLRAELLKQTPTPPAGGGTDSIEYTKEIETATSAGDYAKVAYYTRLAAQQEQEKR